MSVTFWARTDSNSANNPALNLTVETALEITFVPSGTNGDIILEGSGATDPDTEVVIDGVSYNFTFEFQGTAPTANNQGAGQLPPELVGSTIMLITVIDFPSPGNTTRLTFFPDEDPTEATMDSIGNGRIRVNDIDTVGPGVVCFGTGTLLHTPDGERAVETLRIGDLVATLDNGPLPIIWIAKTEYTWPGASETALPVLISKGALDQGKPTRDLVVSPQHKVLMNWAVGEDGVLAPAKALTKLPGIRVMRGKKSVTYHHILLERHAIILSEGLPSESFFPGPTALQMLRPEQRLAIQAAIGPGEDGYGSQARRCLTFAETQTMAQDMRNASKASETAV